MITKVTMSSKVSLRADIYDAGGKVTGDIRVDGHPMVASTFARISGYVSPVNFDASAH